MVKVPAAINFLDHIAFEQSLVLENKSSLGVYFIKDNDNFAFQRENHLIPCSSVKL